MQEINGEQAVQLLRYRNYTAGNEDRTAMQIDFIKEVLRQKITFENLPLAKEIFTALKNTVADTNIDERTFENYTDLLFSLSTEYQFTDILRYPGNFREENGINFYIPNLITALLQYREYRTPIGTGVVLPPVKQSEEEAAPTDIYE